MEERIREESARAVSGALAIGTGQAAVVVVAAFTALFLPRVFGVDDYGRWILYRSVISLLVFLCVAGTSDLLGRYYVAEAAQGRRDDAARLFKLVAATRGVGVLVGSVVSFLVLRSSVRLSLGTPARVLSGVSIAMIVAGLTFQALLYCERRMRRMALLNVLNAGLVPALVLAARWAVGFRLVPWAAAAGDAAYALVALGLARDLVRWPRGWPPCNRWPGLLKFAAGAGFATMAMSLYANLPPSLMLMAGMSAAELGLMGLALRVGELVKMTLVATGSALFPSIIFVFEHGGAERAVQWQERALRIGALLALAAAGVFGVLGSTLVPLIWGEAYRAAVGPMALLLLSNAFVWVGLQHGWFGMLMRSGTVAAASGAGLVLSFLVLFRVFSAAGARGVAMALLGASVLFMVFSILHARLAWGRRFPLHRLGLPLALAAATLWIPETLTASLPVAFLCAGCWLAAFAAAAALGGGLRLLEVRELWAHLRGAR